MRPRVAVLSPPAAANASEPSTARRMARLLQRALDMAGFSAVSVPAGRAQSGGCAADHSWVGSVAQRLRDDPAGDPVLVLACGVTPESPDLIGPALARLLAAPYAIAVGRRPTDGCRDGAVDAAFDAAALVLWTDPDTLQDLQARRPAGQRLVQLAPFTALGAAAARPISPEGPLRILAATMFDRPEKAVGAARLGQLLGLLSSYNWRLEVMGDGQFADRAATALAPLGSRVRWLGARNLRRDVHDRYAEADLVVWPDPVAWPAMTAMEAQAMGRAAVFADCPAARAVLAPECPSPAPGDLSGFAAAIDAFARDRKALASAGLAARRWMERRHGIEAAARRLTAALALIGVQPWGPT
jgi:glycosyltransferase involved in cell wall biosynthesis